MIERALARLHEGWRRLRQGPLARRAATVLGMRIVADALALATGLVLARTLRAEGYGIVVLAQAWVAVLVVPACVGQDRLLVREVAVLEARERWGLLRGLLGWSTSLVIGASVSLVIAAGALIWSTGVVAADVRPAVMMALVLVPVMTLTRLRQATLQGLHHVVLGNVPDLVRPAVFLALFLGAWLWLGPRVEPAGAIVLLGVSAGAAYATAAWLLRRHLPPPVRRTPAEHADTVWVRAGVPLTLLSLLYVLTNHLDVLLLGGLRGAAETAVFRVADRGAQLVGIAGLVTNMSFAPAMAKLHALGRLNELQRLLTRGARGMLLLAVPVALVIAAGGRWFLGWFGPGFADGYVPLLILVSAQLARALSGNVNTLLIMTGHERLVTGTVALGVVVNAAMNLFLIPRWGGTGAALGTFASIALVHGTLVVIAWRRLGLGSTFAGASPPGSRTGTGSADERPE